jgi:HK97 family phage major capsid protein
MNKILELRKERTALVKEAKAIVEKAEAEKRDLTEDEQKAYDGLMARIGTNKADETRHIQLNGLENELAPQEPIKPDPGVSTRTRKTVGRAFVESEQYKAMRKSGKYESDAFEIERRDIVSSDEGSAGDLIVPERVPGIITEPERAFRIRDLLAKATTTSNSIEFVRETLFTDNAAVVAESKEGSGGEVEKPESGLTFENDSVPVVTVAHWIPATRQVVADAPGLAAYINSRLIYGLKLEEEDQLLNQTGAPNIDGLINQAQAFNIALNADDTAIDIIRKGVLQARLAEYPVNGVVLHPTDFANIELLKDSTGRYIWVTVPEGGQMRLWRVPVVETTAITEGTFLLGAFGLGAQIWDRETVGIRISEHHADFFIKNMVAILCEERIALTVYRPQAFVTGSLTVGS